MKKISKILLLSIMGLAFLGTAMSCSHGNSDSGGYTNEATPESEKTPVKSKDGLLSVTPTEDGLVLKITKQKGWAHLSFLILEYPDNDWAYEPIEMSIPIEPDERADSKAIEKTFKLVTKGKKYKIWYQHHGKLKQDGTVDEWDGYYSAERDGAALVTAIGGSGDLHISCDKGYYLSPRRGIYMKNLNIEKPSILKDDEIRQRWHVRVENGGRWQNDTSKGELYDRPFEGDVIWFPDDFAPNEYLKKH